MSAKKTKKVNPNSWEWLVWTALALCVAFYVGAALLWLLRRK